MRWRNPAVELPEQNQKVWVMLEPHKERGTLLESAEAIEILCGETEWRPDMEECRVTNGDELGYGNLAWYLASDIEANDPYRRYAMAWMPVEEMPLPIWWKTTVEVLK